MAEWGNVLGMLFSNGIHVAEIAGECNCFFIHGFRIINWAKVDALSVSIV